MEEEKIILKNAVKYFSDKSAHALVKQVNDYIKERVIAFVYFEVIQPITKIDNEYVTIITCKTEK